MANYTCLRETGKRRLYAITNPAWNARLSASDNAAEAFATFFENTHHESVTHIAHGKINSDQWYFKTFYLPIMEGE